jgi:16S rRNA (cytosine967-C5)-methyltransferase
VNAVLRRFLREQEACVQAVLVQPTARWNHPDWWIDRLQADWPQQAQALLQAANQHPPMSLRVNRRRSSVAAYRQSLVDAGLPALTAAPGIGGDALLVLAEPCAVSRLPGFAEGLVSVQDAHAQRAAPLLLGPQGLPPAARVLDACAAPGGKTAHLLELAELDLLALDQDARRLQRVSENLQRLGLQARVQAADACRPADWWDGRPFDAILLDAPCTASGIVRRHPDVRWLRRPNDVDALARQQAAMLDALWPLLRPGGRLLYATCSVFRAEGSQQIDAFLQRVPLGSAHVDGASPGHLLPLPENPLLSPADRVLPPGDGFFYALLIKR